MKNIEALIADGGEITLGAIDSIECAATAADHHNSLALLVRRSHGTRTLRLLSARQGQQGFPCARRTSIPRAS